MDTIYIAAVSSMVGAAAPIIAKFIIDFFISKRKLDIEQLNMQFNEVQEERQNNYNNLQKQVFDLREQLLTLQKENLTYIQENAELKAKITILTKENEMLKAHLVHLDEEIRKLKGLA